jgi:hypothetical protein
MLLRMDNPDIMALCRPHEGTWRGQYRHFDTQGTLVDAHDSEIINAFPAEGPYAYVQTSRFLWADGRAEEHVFPGRLDGNRLLWEPTGWSARPSPAPTPRTPCSCASLGSTCPASRSSR